MVKPLDWTQYLTTKVSQQSYAASQRQCGDALIIQRDIIGRLVNGLGPKSITCLGSGFLNDIPVNLLFERENNIVLVDWIDGVSRQGVAHQIIQKCNDEYHCLFCDKRIGPDYCKNFSNKLLSEGVCTEFIPAEGVAVTCANYEPHIEPSFLRCDVTAGYGNNFAETIQKKISSCRTPKEAFIKAIKTCSQLESKKKPIPLDDNSVDLLTSSMVLSQFDNEPYSYFAVLLEQNYGREQILAHEKTLRPLMEQLRTKLFVEQVRQHVQEMHRLVKKDGNARVYFSVELFRSDNYDGLYFMVQDMPKAMDIISEYFLFDLDLLPRNDVLQHVNIDGETSVIQNYVLAPRMH